MTGMNCGLDTGRCIAPCAHNVKSGGLDFFGKCSVGNHIPALEHGIGRKLFFNSARGQLEGNAISGVRQGDGSVVFFKKTTEPSPCLIKVIPLYLFLLGKW